MSRPEFSRPLAVARLRAEGDEIAIEAGPDEREAVRARLGLEGLDCLSAHLVVRPRRAGVVAANGLLRAEVRQVCVLTLEPFASTVEVPVRLVFRPAGPAGEGREIALDPEGEDEILYAGADIDLGEAMVETLALALDPWPKRPGAVFDWTDKGRGEEPQRSPFSVLERRRDAER
ncbi:MAG: DUF177 domain-containing protein [Elioraea sp.]|nr:DUF177 domain-containing protein [Elioraea sp.]